MSIQSAQAFMNKVANTEALQVPFIDAWTLGGMKAVLTLGERQGYQFTDKDVIAVRDMPKSDASPALKAFGAKLSSAMDMIDLENPDELTDNQLEMVAGGSGATGPGAPPSGNV